MESKVRLAAKLTFDSVVDGEGLRVVLWTQGCPHRCSGCHNPHTHDPQAGFEMELHQLLQQIKANPMQEGLTLSGGEPFDQADVLVKLAKEVKGLGLNIWAYTGYHFEQLLQDETKKALLQQVDVLIDGPFCQQQHHPLLYFKGSRNQRVIDVPASLQSKQIIVLD
ncbi:MAG: anaerobic ribonucleoside-triphosphate reductase activating protein [Erysipelotrichaceae bacterium]